MAIATVGHDHHTRRFSQLSSRFPSSVMYRSALSSAVNDINSGSSSLIRFSACASRFLTLTSKVEAVFTCTCANVEYLVAIFQIFFYVVNGSQKFNSCGFGMIEPCILVEYIVGSVYTFTLIFYFCKLFKVRFIYTSRFSHIN